MCMFACMIVRARIGALPVEVLYGEVPVGTGDTLSYEVLLQDAERVSLQHLQPVQQLRNTHAVRRTQYKY